jgi:hypothetical protein
MTEQLTHPENYTACDNSRSFCSVLQTRYARAHALNLYVRKTNTEGQDKITLLSNSDFSAFPTYSL